MVRIAVLIVAGTALVAGCTTAGRATVTTSTPVPATSTAATDTSRPATSTAPTTPAASTPTATATPVQPPGGPVPPGFTPVSATFVSPTAGWVLGTAPCAHPPCTSVLRTVDGGRTWRGIPAPVATLGVPGTGRDGDVSVLRFATTSDGWAGVGRLFATHDGGAHWTAEAVGAPRSTVTSIETGGGYVYVVTDNCPSQGGTHCSQTVRVYASPIGADHWTPVTATVPGGAQHLVVHGADWFLATQAGIWHGHAEQSATRGPNPCPPTEGQPAGAATLAIADLTHLDAACMSDGGDGSATYTLYGTTTDGVRWAPMGVAHREASGLGGIADNTRDVLIMAVASGDSEILRTTDGGRTLVSTHATSVTGGLQWTDVGFTTPTQAIAVLETSGLYVSRDAGLTWLAVRFG